MSGYYTVNILPIILNRFKVKNIVISGLSNNETINQVLNYCNQTNSIKICIDLYDDSNEEIINDFTLNVLPNLSNYDAIFLNDDPNWYTVFNELNIIKENNQKFPLVFICHNVFPHKRRDSYINPNVIPKEFLNDYSKELFYNGKYIQDEFFHAIDENTSNNGVLTAIEDFIEENSLVDIMDINFLEGLTILYFKDDFSKFIIKKLIQDLEEYKLQDNILKNIDDDKNNVSNLKKKDMIKNFKVKLNEKDKIIQDFENQIKIHSQEINLKNSQIENYDSQLDLKETQLKNIESKLLNRDVTINNLNNDLLNANNEIDSLNIQIKGKKQEIHKIKQEMNSFKHQYTNQLSKLDNKEFCISCFKEEIANNHLEIDYLKKESFIRKISNPFSYIYLIFKSNPKEIFLNFKLYKALKSSKCFNIGFYLNNNKDIVESKWCKYFSPELHYVCNGFYEGREFNKKYFNRNSKKELLDYILNCK